MPSRRQRPPHDAKDRGQDAAEDTAADADSGTPAAGQADTPPASRRGTTAKAPAKRRRTASPSPAGTARSRAVAPTPTSGFDAFGGQVRALAGSLAGKAAERVARAIGDGLAGGLTGGLGGGLGAVLAGGKGGGRIGQLPLDAARLLLQTLAAAGLTPARAGRAGAALRKLREAAGLTVDEVSRALDLKDPALIEQLEGGKVALPFELILRLAGVLGRNDPIGFVMKLTRSANPALWRTLEDLGVGRLVVQGAREREFANIYRANDAARQLSDADFAAVLAFTRSAFDTAIAFRQQSRTAARGAAAGAGPEGEAGG